MMAPRLRYHHMTADVLANVVFQCPLMQKSPVRQTVLCSALVQREASLTALASGTVLRGSRNRGLPLSEAQWSYDEGFAQEELEFLEPNESTTSHFLAAGYIASLRLRREGDVLAAYLHLGQIAEGQKGGPAPGVGLQITLRLAGTEYHGTHFVTKEGSLAGFKESWAAVVREGSPYFVDGPMKVTIELKLATTQG